MVLMVLDALLTLLMWGGTMCLVGQVRNRLNIVQLVWDR